MTHLEAVEPTTLPGAWYDLSVRVGEARAVADCALESLPCGLNDYLSEKINTTSHLIGAVQDILRLMAADVELIEHQLKA